MGTVVSFDVPALARDNGALAAAIRRLHWADETFSTYRPASDVSRLARAEATLADCAPEVAEVLAACEALAGQTGGYFSAYPAGTLDPSGYVKGWAVEQAARIIAAGGSTAHTVNGGGDIQCVGDRGPGQPWRVGIAHPLRPGRLALVVSGQDFAVATSGTAERGPHVINPHTGQPAVGLASVTVVGASLATADAYATAAFAMGPAARDWAESLDGYEAFAITAAGAAWQTAGFGSYLG